MITVDQIIKWGGNQNAAPHVCEWFNHFSKSYAIDTPLRISAFFAQVIHESGGFHYTQEIASGRAYEGRVDLGNVFPGDGIKFKGRGYIQVTGRSNYTAMSKAIFKDRKTLIQHPEFLQVPQYAMQSAFIFWYSKGLNIFASLDIDHTIKTKKHGILKPFKYITLLINGGFNGFKERVEIYNRICSDFKLPLYKLP